MKFPDFLRRDHRVSKHDPAPVLKAPVYNASKDMIWDTKTNKWVPMDEYRQEQRDKLTKTHVPVQTPPPIPEKSHTPTPTVLMDDKKDDDILDNIATGIAVTELVADTVSLFSDSSTDIGSFDAGGGDFGGGGATGDY